jgi:hypothetical protein
MVVMPRQSRSVPQWYRRLDRVFVFAGGFATGYILSTYMDRNADAGFFLCWAILFVIAVTKLAMLGWINGGRNKIS